MEGFKDRFVYALERAQKTKAQLSRETGIGEPLLYFYASGRNEPKQKNLEKIAKALHVSVDWLVTGKEPDPEKVLIETYKRLPDFKREELLRFAAYLERYEELKNGPQD